MQVLFFKIDFFFIPRKMHTLVSQNEKRRVPAVLLCALRNSFIV